MTTIEPGPVATKFADNAKFGELDTTVDGLDEPSLNLIKKSKPLWQRALQICSSKVTRLQR